MADLERLLDEFVAEHRAGADPDPRRYLADLDEGECAELASLIDAYLARAPGRRWDPDAFAASPARETAEAATRALTGRSGSWPVLLPRLRKRAELRRDELVARLADKLGVADRSERVAAYYHRMEHGSLPAAGVSDRVLEALGSIVGAGAGALRRAGEAIAPAEPAEPADPFFARVAVPDPTYGPPGEEDAAAGGREPGAEPDEVDELFTGGAGEASDADG